MRRKSIVVPSSYSRKRNLIVIKMTIFLVLLLAPFIMILSIISPLDNRINKFQELPEMSWAMYSYAYEWDQNWANPDIEFCNDMAIDDLDNIYLVGSTDAGIYEKYQLVVKFDKYGNQLWNFSGNLGDILDIDLNSKQEVFIIAGNNLTKMNRDGSINWTKTYPTNLNSLHIDSFDHLYLSGESKNYFIMKCNSSGDLLWNCSFSDISPSQIQSDNLGNVYLSGTTTLYGAGGSDACLIKFNNTGGYLWHRTFGGPDNDKGNTLAIDINNSVFLAGSIEYTHSDDMFVAKFDENGTKIYHQIVGIYNRDEYCRSLLLKNMNIEHEDIIFLCGEYYYTAFDRNMAIYSISASSSSFAGIYHVWDAQDEYHSRSSAFDSDDNIFIAGWVRITYTGDYDMCFARFGKDSDGDGLSDYQELNVYQTNPEQYDSDSDGLNDFEEVKIYDTDPNNPDTDGDGFNDEDEILQGFDPNNPLDNQNTIVNIIFLSHMVPLIIVSITILIVRRFIVKGKRRSLST